MPDEAPRAEQCAIETRLSGQPIESTKKRRREGEASLSVNTTAASTSKEGDRLKRAKYETVCIAPPFQAPSESQAQPFITASLATVSTQSADQSVDPLGSSAGKGTESQGPGEVPEVAAVTKERARIPADADGRLETGARTIVGPWAQLGLQDPVSAVMSSAKGGVSRIQGCASRNERPALSDSPEILVKAEAKGTSLDENLIQKASDDVTDGPRARKREGPCGRFLRDVCALANELPGRKEEALRRMQPGQGSKRLSFDARKALALLEALERAARPFLLRNAATGRFEIVRGPDGCEKVKLDGWHEIVVQEVGLVSKWADLAPKSDAQTTGRLSYQP